jgi:hypothetical protein
MMESPPLGATLFQIRNDPYCNRKQEKHPSNTGNTAVVQLAVWKFAMELHQDSPVIPIVHVRFLEIIPARYPKGIASPGERLVFRAATISE